MTTAQNNWNLNDANSFRLNVQHEGMAEFDVFSKTVTLSIDVNSYGSEGGIRPRMTASANLASMIYNDLSIDDWNDTFHTNLDRNGLESQKASIKFNIIFNNVDFDGNLDALFDCLNLNFNLVRVVFKSTCTSNQGSNDVDNMFRSCGNLKECIFDGTMSTDQETQRFHQKGNTNINMFTNCASLEKLDLSMLTFGKQESTSNTVLRLGGLANGCTHLKEFHMPKINTVGATHFDEMLSGDIALKRFYMTSAYGTSFNFQGIFGSNNQSIEYIDLDLSITNTATISNLQDLFPQKLKVLYDRQNPFTMLNIDGKLVVSTSGGVTYKTNINLVNQSTGRPKDYYINNTGTNNRLTLMNFGNGNINSAEEMVYYQNYIDGIYSDGTATYNGYTIESFNGAPMRLANVASYDTKAYKYVFNNCKFPTGMTEMFMNDTVVSVKLNSGCTVTSSNAFSKAFSSYLINDCTIECPIETSDVSSMFSGASSLTSVSLTNFTLKGDIDASYMFNGCRLITSIPQFNISNGLSINATAMFKSCTGITSDINLENYFPNVFNGDINFDSMFYGCNSVQRITLPSLESNGIVNLNQIFRDTSLSHVVINKINANTIIATNMMMNARKSELRTIKISSRNCFYENSSSSKNLCLTTYRDDSSTTGTILYTFPYNDVLTEFAAGDIDHYVKGFYNGANSEIIYNLEDFLTESTKSENISIQGNNCTVTLSNKQIESQLGGRISLNGHQNDIESTGKNILYEFNNCTFKYGLATLFENCDRLTSIKFTSCKFGVKIEDTSTDADINLISNSLTESFKKSFAGCSNLVSFTMSNSSQYKLDKSNPEAQYSYILTSNISDMFNGCIELQTLSLGMFRLTGDVNCLRSFKDCQKLSSLIRPAYEYVTNINYTESFENCALLVEHNLGVINIPNGEVNMTKMYYCDVTGQNNIIVKIASIKCKKLILESVFGPKSSPTEITLPKIEVNELVIRNMFDECEDLNDIYINSITADDLIDLSTLTKNCNGLLKLGAVENALFTLNKSDPNSEELPLLKLDELCKGNYIESFDLPLLHVVNYNISMVSMLEGVKPASFNGYNFDITTATGINNTIDLTRVMYNIKPLSDDSEFKSINIDISCGSVNLTSAFVNSSIENVNIKLTSTSKTLTDVFGTYSGKTVIKSLTAPTTDININNKISKLYNLYEMSDVFLHRTVNNGTNYEEVYYNNNEPTWFIDDVSKFCDATRSTTSRTGKIVTMTFDNIVIRNMKDNTSPSIQLNGSEQLLPGYIDGDDKYIIIFKKTVFDHGLKNMFKDTNQIQQVIIENTCRFIDTDNYSTCESCFENSNIEEISINIPMNVSNYSNMFKNCNSLTSAHLQGIENNVINCSSMFEDCSSLITVEMSAPIIPVESIDCSAMFKDCTSIASIQSFITFITSPNINYSEMFKGCTNMTNISTMQMSSTNIINCTSMFENCSTLPSYDLGTIIATEEVNLSSMFSGCSSMISSSITSIDGSYLNMSYMFSRCNKLESFQVGDITLESSVDTSIFNNMFNGAGLIIDPTDAEMKNKQVVITQGKIDSKGYINMNEMFNNSNIMVVNFDEIIGVSITMNNMLKSCKYLQSITMSPITISNELNLDDMFGDETVSEITNNKLTTFTLPAISPKETTNVITIKMKNTFGNSYESLDTIVFTEMNTSYKMCENSMDENKRSVYTFGNELLKRLTITMPKDNIYRRKFDSHEDDFITLVDYTNENDLTYYDTVTSSFKGNRPDHWTSYDDMAIICTIPEVSRVDPYIDYGIIDQPPTTLSTRNICMKTEINNVKDLITIMHAQFETIPIADDVNDIYDLIESTTPENLRWKCISHIRNATSTTEGYDSTGNLSPNRIRLADTRVNEDMVAELGDVETFEYKCYKTKFIGGIPEMFAGTLILTSVTFEECTFERNSSYPEYVVNDVPVNSTVGETSSKSDKNGLFYKAFENCTKLQKLEFIPIANLPQDKIQCNDFGYMCAGCTSLEKIDFMEAFNTNIEGKIIMMSNTFANCTGLNDILDFSKLIPSTSGVLNCYELNLFYTFHGCTSIKNIINFPSSIIADKHFTENSSSLINFNHTFSSCSNLINIVNDSNIPTESIIKMPALDSIRIQLTYMFADSIKINHIQLNSMTIGVAQRTNGSYGTGPLIATYIFTGCKGLKVIDYVDDAVITSPNTVNFANMISETSLSDNPNTAFDTNCDLTVKMPPIKIFETDLLTPASNISFVSAFANSKGIKYVEFGDMESSTYIQLQSMFNTTTFNNKDFQEGTESVHIKFGNLTCQVLRGYTDNSATIFQGTIMEKLSNNKLVSLMGVVEIGDIKISTNNLKSDSTLQRMCYGLQGLSRIIIGNIEITKGGTENSTFILDSLCALSSATSLHIGTITSDLPVTMIEMAQKSSCTTVSIGETNPLTSLRCQSLDMTSAFDTCFALKYLRIPSLIVTEGSVTMLCMCRNCNSLQWLCGDTTSRTDAERKLISWEIRTEKAETIGGITEYKIIPGNVSLQSMFEQSGLREFIMPTISNIDDRGNKGLVNVRLMIAYCANLTIADFKSFSFMEHLIQYVYAWGHNERSFVDDSGVTRYVGWYYRYDGTDYRFVSKGEVGRNFTDETVPHTIPSDEYYNPSTSGILLFSGSVNNLDRVYLRKADYVEYGVNKNDLDVSGVNLADTVIANVRVKIAYNGDYRSIVSEGNEVYSAIGRNIRYTVNYDDETNIIYYGGKSSEVIETIEQLGAVINPSSNPPYEWSTIDGERICTITIENKIINSINKGLESILITLRNNEELILPKDPLDNKLKKYKFIFKNCEFKNGLQNFFEETKYVIDVVFDNCKIHKIIYNKMPDGTVSYQIFNPSPLTETFTDSISIKNVSFIGDPVICSDISYMFKGAINITNINLSNIYLTKFVNLSYLFDGCTKLESFTWPTIAPYHPPEEGSTYSNDIPFSGINMQNMFANTKSYNICNIPAIKFLKTKNPVDDTGVDGVVLELSNMFYLSNIDTINIHEINMNTVVSELRANDWINNCDQLHYISLPYEMEEYNPDTKQSLIKMIVPVGGDARSYLIPYEVQHRISDNITYLTFHDAPLLINTEEAFIRYAIENYTEKIINGQTHKIVTFNNVNINTQISMQSVEGKNIKNSPFFNTSIPYHLIYDNIIISQPLNEMFKNSGNCVEFVLKNCSFVLENDEFTFDDMFNGSNIKAVDIKLNNIDNVFTMRRMFMNAIYLETVLLSGIKCKDFTYMFQSAQVTLAPNRIDLSKLTATPSTSDEEVVLNHLFDSSSRIIEVVWPSFDQNTKYVSLQSAFERSSVTTTITIINEDEIQMTLPNVNPSVSYNLYHCFYKCGSITSFIIPDLTCENLNMNEMFGDKSSPGFISSIEIGKLEVNKLNMRDMLAGCSTKLITISEINTTSTNVSDVNIDFNFNIANELPQQIKGIISDSNYKPVTIDDVEKYAFINVYHKPDRTPLIQKKIDKVYVKAIEASVTTLVYYIDTGKRPINSANDFATYTNDTSVYEMLADGTCILKMDKFIINTSFADPIVLKDSIEDFHAYSEATGYRVYFTNCEFPQGLPKLFEGFDKLISVSFKSVSGEDGNNDIGDTASTNAKNAWYHSFANCPKLQSIDLSLTAARLPVFESAEQFAYNCPLLDTVNLTNFTFSGAVDFNSAFENCTMLSAIRMPLFKNTTSANLSKMFSGCSGLVTITSKLDSKLSGPVNCSYMFSECMALKSISSSGQFMLLESLTDTNTLNCERIFYNCISLKQCHMNNSTVGYININFNEAFSGCIVLESYSFPSLTGWKVNSDVKLARMFYGCSTITTMDLSSITLLGDVDMSYMFSGCTVLENFIFPKIDQENLQSINLTRTFYNCRRLFTINFATPITAQYDINMYETFRGCGFSVFELTNIVSVNGSINFTKCFRMCSSLKHLTINEVDFVVGITLSKLITKCPSIETLTMPKDNLIINEDESDYYLIIYNKGGNVYQEQIPYIVNNFEETDTTRKVFFSDEQEPEEEEEEYPEPPEPPAPIEPTIINTIDEFISYAKQPGHYNTRTVTINGVAKPICIVTFNTCTFNPNDGTPIKLDGHIEELPGYNQKRSYRFLFSSCSFPNGLPEMFEYTNQVSLVRLDERCVVSSTNGDAFRETFFDCPDLATVRIECKTDNKNSMNGFGECPNVNIVDMSEFNYTENMILANLCYNDVKLEEYEWPTYSNLEKVDLRNMFYNCKSLLDGTIPKIEASEYIYANNMFENSGVTEVSIPSLTAPVVDLTELTKGAKNLTTLDIRTINADRILTSGMLDGANNLVKLMLPASIVKESNGELVIVDGNSTYKIPMDVDSYEVMGDVIIIRFTTAVTSTGIDEVTKSIFLARQMQILSRLRKLQLAYANTEDKYARQIILEEINDIERTVRYMKLHNQWIMIHEYITKK